MDPIPSDPVDKELWALGFTSEQREKIKKVAIDYALPPVLLGKMLWRWQIENPANVSNGVSTPSTEAEPTDR